MPSRDKNGNDVFSQAEYEHYVFSGDRFSGFVEGMGYVLEETVVVPSPFNRSGTHIMQDICHIQCVFDMSEMSYNDEPTLSNRNQTADKTPDRSDYWTHTVPKREYAEDWYNPINVAAFVDNVAINLVNSTVLSVVNTFAYSGQVLAHEGVSSWLDYEGSGTVDQIKGIGTWFVDQYNYVTGTPASQQWSDFKRDISNPNTWDEGVAMGVGMYGLAKGSGKMPKAQIPIKTMPAGAHIPKQLYPKVTTSDGFFFKGFNIKSPMNISAQRFGQLRINDVDFWGIKTTSKESLVRRFYAVKPLWNDLDLYTTGTIPKGTTIKIGIVGPQYPISKFPGGSIQIIVKSRGVVNQTTKIVNTKK